MEVGPVVKAANPDLYQTVKSLKTTGIKYLKNPNQRNPMTAKKKIVIVKFEYINPKTRESFFAIKGWPCKSKEDAELTVKYYGMKTGSVEAQCNLEELTDEEIKSAQTKAITAQKNQTQSKQSAGAL